MKKIILFVLCLMPFALMGQSTFVKTTVKGTDAKMTRGVCWNTSSNPTISNPKTSNGTGTGTFISNITGLTPATTYHVRAYATNEAGTYYGADIEFTTTSSSGLSGDIVFSGVKSVWVKVGGVWYIVIQ